MTVTDLVPPAARAWEAAYLRFETPEQEIQKFIRRLRMLGAGQWRRDAAILELFCGRGNGLVALGRLGFTRVTGIDLSMRLVAMHEGFGSVCVADGRLLPVRSASQRIVVVQGGLHHLEQLPRDLLRVADEVRRVLEPDGLFVVVEPWRTPFLDGVHTLARSRIARRVWGKLDALATMIELEGETYQRWLRRPELIASALEARFEPRLQRRRWGKLLFVGRRRDAVAPEQSVHDQTNGER